MTVVGALRVGEIVTGKRIAEDRPIETLVREPTKDAGGGGDLGVIVVPASAKVRLRIVIEGTDENHASQTAKPLASPDRIGSSSGVYIPIIWDGWVPGSVSL